MIFLLLLCGCPSPNSLWDDTADTVTEYDGKEYKAILYWDVIDRENYSIEEAMWQGHVHNVRVYDDPEKRFIFDEYFQLLCHRIDDPLPQPKDDERIEKIRFGSTTEVLYSDSDIEKIKAMAELMAQPYQKEAFKNNSPIEETITQIFVYYYDYPAFHWAAALIRAQDGSYGFVMNDWKATMEVSNCDYIAIPTDAGIVSFFEHM